MAQATGGIERVCRKRATSRKIAQYDEQARNVPPRVRVLQCAWSESEGLESQLIVAATGVEEPDQRAHSVFRADSGFSVAGAERPFECRSCFCKAAQCEVRVPDGAVDTGQ